VDRIEKIRGCQNYGVYENLALILVLRISTVLVLCIHLEQELIRLKIWFCIHLCNCISKMTNDNCVIVSRVRHIIRYFRDEESLIGSSKRRSVPTWYTVCGDFDDSDNAADVFDVFNEVHMHIWF